MSKVIDRIKLRVLDTLKVDANKSDYLALFDMLSEADKRLAFKYIGKAYKETAIEQVMNGDIVNIPFIGKLKIKAVRQFAINHMKDVAKELGYNDYNLIPKDKLDYAKNKVKELTLADRSVYKIEQKKLRSKRKAERILQAKQIEQNKNPTIFTFNLKKT